MKFLLTYSFISEHSIHGVFVLEGNSQEGGEQYGPAGRVLRHPLLGKARQAAYSSPTRAELSVLGVIFDRLLE